MREIVPGILTWPWFSEPHGYNFNGHLVLHREGNICIDPVEPDAASLEELCRRSVAKILLTNRNHVRAANQVKAKTGARTAIHAADAAYARSRGAELDDELRVGEKVGPVQVVAVPGKSPGEVALWWPERRVLIVGDAVIGNPPGSLSLLREAVMDDPPTLRESVRSLLRLDFDTVLVGDGESVVESAKERLRDLVATFPGPG